MFAIKRYNRYGNAMVNCINSLSESIKRSSKLKALLRIYLCIFIVLFCLGNHGFAANLASPSEVDNKITVMTYNVLFPQTKGKHKSPYSTSIGYNQNKKGVVYENSIKRQKIIIENIQNAPPCDIICLQEVTKGFFDKLKKDLTQNEYAGEYRSHNKSQENTHGVAIFYKQHRFERISSGTSGFFSIEKVNAAGQVIFYNNEPVIKPRAHLVLDLRDRTTKKNIRVVSCHLFDPRELMDEKSKHVDAVLDSVLNFTKHKFEPHVLVIAGDFNQDQWGDNGRHYNCKPSLSAASAFKPLFDDNFKVDDDLIPSVYCRVDGNNYNSDIVPNGRKIDHIFVKWIRDAPDLCPESVAFLEFDHNGSDHRAVISSF